MSSNSRRGYFQRLIRRHPAISFFWLAGRRVDILGGATGLNYASEYRDVDGIIVPTKRRIYAYEGDYQLVEEITPALFRFRHGLTREAIDREIADYFDRFPSEVWRTRFHEPEELGGLWTASGHRFREENWI